MADITLTPESISRSGLEATYTGSLSTGNTYFVANNENTFLHFKKSGAGDCDVTIVTSATVLGYAVSDVVVTVPASTGDVFIGPFPKAVFGANITFTADEITGLTVACLRL